MLYFQFGNDKNKQAFATKDNIIIWAAQSYFWANSQMELLGMKAGAQASKRFCFGLLTATTLMSPIILQTCLLYDALQLL